MAEVASGPRPGTAGWLTAADRFAQAHDRALALAIVAAGFALRLALSIPSYLNPDEILHVIIAGDTTFADSLARAAFYLSPHPFFYNLLLYLLNLLHASEPILRLPSVIAGALVPWFTYLWLKRVSGPVAALVAAAVIAFLPDTIRLAAQVREYALLMMLLSAALWLVETGIDRQRAGPVLGSGALLLVALATHYATIWFIPGYALYAVLRLRATAAPRRLWLAFAAVLAAFAAGLAVAWFTHIHTLMGKKQSDAADNWLRDCYFQRGTDKLWVYPFKQTFAVFRYLFSGAVSGAFGLLLTLAGAVWLVARRRWHLLLLLALPFATNCAGSVIRLYPYGGMRHLAYLTPYAAVAIGILAAQLTRQRMIPALAGVGLLLAAANLNPDWPVDHIRPSDQRRAVLDDAMAYVRNVTPPGGTILFDFETGLFMRWYFGEERVLSANRAPDSRFWEWTARGCRMVQIDPDFAFWSLSPRRLGEVAGAMFESYGFEPGEPVTVIDAGWGWNLVPGLMGVYGIEYPVTRQFGNAISVFRLPAGHEPNSRRAAQALVAVARVLQVPPDVNVRTVLWPSDQPTAAVAAQVRGLALQGMPYLELRASLRERRTVIGDHLPALAFWVFGNHERHGQPFRSMDGHSSFETPDLHFRLVAVDPEGIVGVYFIF